MQQLPIHVLFKFSILCSQLGVLAFSLSWSLVTCNESKQLCQECNIQVFTFGEKLELSSVLKIKTITLPVPILFAEWVLAFQHCKRVLQQNYAQHKRRQKNAQYNNIYVEISHTVSKSYWFDSITILASLIISVAGQPLQKCFGYRLPHLTGQNKNIISLFPLSRSQCTSQIDMNYDKHAFNKV